MKPTPSAAIAAVQVVIARRRQHSTPQWKPNPCRGCNDDPAGCDVCGYTGMGPQGAFMSIDTDILGYGGAAGGGKTSSAAVKAVLKWGKLKGFSAILFRRTRPEAKESLWEEIDSHYPFIDPGVDLTESRMTCKLTSGARIKIGYLEHPKHRKRYQGGGYQYVAFDEASHFAEADIRYLFTRQRSASGIPSQLVLCTNPPGVTDPGREWLFKWFAPWVDPSFPDPALPREIRYFIPAHDAQGQAIFQWHIDGRLVRNDDPGRRSIAFIPAALEDNQALTTNDPEYEDRLRQTDYVTFQQLRFGNWLIKPSGGGKVREFNRGRHVKSFAERIGCRSLREAVGRAIVQGWAVTTGWDHGQSAGRECCVVIIHNDHIQEAWAIGVYINLRRTVPQDDAIAVRRLLDALGISPFFVSYSLGDVGNTGKGTKGDSNLSNTINLDLSSVRFPDESYVLGFAISTPRKEDGSVTKGVELLNVSFHNDRLFLDNSVAQDKTDLATPLESWSGGEPYKDPVDALRYPMRQIAERWMFARRGVSGTSSG